MFPGSGYSPCIPVLALLPAAYRPVCQRLVDESPVFCSWKVTLPSLSHGAPPVVYATPGDKGTTSLVMSSPSLSLIRDDVCENQDFASGSIPLKSSTQVSPSRASSGPMSSPFSLLILPPEPSTSIGMWIPQSLIVSGCLGVFPIPLSSMPADSARADPVPEPSLGFDHSPWCPSVARMTAFV